MTAPLDDATGLEHDDLIGIDDGRQPMRNHQRRAVRGDRPQGILDGRLVARIKRRGGFVEQEHRRVLEQHAGDGHTLFFAARQLQAALAHRRVPALRQRGDEGTQLRRIGGRVDIGGCGIRLAIGHVVAQAVVKEHSVLRHDADRAAQARLRDRSQILTIDGDRTAGDVIEAKEQTADGGLAGAA